MEHASAGIRGERLFFNASSYSFFAYSKISSEEEFFERRSAIALGNSSSEAIFEKAKNEYEEALKKLTV